MGKLTTSWAEKSGKILYHAIPGEVEGPSIKASENWGMEILPTERKKLGMGPDEHPPLVFAATQLRKALAYAIEKRHGRLCCDTIDSAEAEILITGDRDNFMSRPRNATIYSFSDMGFVNLPNAQHQSASRKAVPFSKTEIALKVENIEDIMRAGLQIFTFKEDATAIYKDKDATRLAAARGEKETVDMLAKLIRSGKVIWENQARGINPNSKLAEMMGIEIPSAARQSPPQKTKAVHRRTARRKGPGSP